MDERQQDQGDTIAAGVGTKDAAQEAAERQDRQYAAESEAPAELYGGAEMGAPRTIEEVLESIGRMAAGGSMGRVEKSDDPKVEELFESLRAAHHAGIEEINRKLEGAKHEQMAAWKRRDLAAFVEAAERVLEQSKVVVNVVEKELEIARAAVADPDSVEIERLHTAIHELAPKVGAAQDRCAELHDRKEQLLKITQETQNGTKAGLDAIAAVARCTREQLDAENELVKLNQQAFELGRKHDLLAEKTGLCTPKYR